jgi:hypothetical protein
MAVGHPEICDTGTTLCFAHRSSDITASNSMVNPEVSNPVVVVPEGETVAGFLVGKEGWIEVQRHVLAAGPIDPTLKVFDTNLISVDRDWKFAVDCMQVQTLDTGQQRVGFFKIDPQLVNAPRLAWVVSSNGNPATKGLSVVLKTAHIVALPAMHRNGSRLRGTNRFGNVNAQRGVPLFSKFKRALNSRITRRIGHPYFFPLTST